MGTVDICGSVASDGDGEMEVEDHNRDMLESQVKQIEQEIRDVKTKLYQVGRKSGIYGADGAVPDGQAFCHTL